jgi:hypothetical protein
MGIGRRYFDSAMVGKNTTGRWNWMGKFTTDNMPPVLRNLINLKAESIILFLFIPYS